MKKLLFLTVLFFGVLSLQAQELSFWHKVNRFLTKPAVVDTSRIYQPKACFSLGLFTTGQKAGFDVDVNFGFNMPDVGLVTGTSSYSLGKSLQKDRP